MLFLVRLNPYNYHPRQELEQYDLNPPVPLAVALMHSASNFCTLDHDKVYSILGIVDGGETFPVRYDSTLLDLMIETSLFCTKQQFAVGFSPQNRDPVESAINYLVDSWKLDASLPGHTVREIIDSRREQLQSHYSDDCYAREVPKIRDFGSGILTSMREALPCNPQLQLLLQSATEQTSCTHCIIDLWGSPAVYPWTASILLLSKDIATLEESRYNIVGQLRILNDGPSVLLVHVYAESYDNPGLPKATVPEKIDITNWETNTVLECFDVRSAVILTGLPYNQKVRKAAMDLLYDVRSFPLPRVTYYSASAPEPCEGSARSVWDRESFPAPFIWEPPQGEPEIF